MKKVQPYLYEPTNEKSLEKANKAIRKKNADFSKLKSPFFKKTNVSSCTCKKCESDAGGCCHFFLNKNNLTESGLAVAKNLLKKFPIFSDNCITDGVEFTEFLSEKVSSLSILTLKYRVFFIEFIYIFSRMHFPKQRVRCNNIFKFLEQVIR
ncbi:hypothetical protein CAEBREN_18307 [Caenorhabditis brenneri]|uniref:Uncharacterized protein n=1 Tax=Caenorhabditis brenneri TaxID=135651 RepID=G0NFL8_CAEBE|nr:hypothetical protein CAEBREN_18307 [Caenorhabditis brenneri]